MASSPVSSIASSPINEPDAKSRYQISAVDEARRRRMNQIRDEMVEIYGELYMPPEVDRKVEAMRARLRKNREINIHGELILPVHIIRKVTQIHHKFSLTHICHKSKE